MYWYYKYPLVIAIALVALGIGYTVWRSLPESLTARVLPAKAAAPDSPAVEVPSGDSAVPAPPAPPVPAALPVPPREEPPPAVALPPVPAPAPAAAPVAVLPSGPAESAAAPREITAPTPPAPAPGGAAAAPGAAPLTEAARLLDTAAHQAAGGNHLAARELAARVLGLPGVVEFDRAWFAAAEVVDQVNRQFMSSGLAHPDRRAYTVQPGDSLSRIATTLNTTVGALQRMNGLDRTNPLIYPGNVLYALNAEWEIRVAKGTFVLLLLNRGRLWRLYHVGVGRDNKTPVGQFVITSKVIHPAWTPPGRSFPFGHPENPLGTHWLGLTPVGNTDPTLRGYGIHGTWEPDTVGTPASEGCVRLRNDDVAELFDFIPEPGRSAPIRVTIEE